MRFTSLICFAFGLKAYAQTVPATSSKSCRNVPGDPGFPTRAQWNAFNASISGRLVTAVPSAEFCRSLPGGACTDAQWVSSTFRYDIPGALNQVNWEQDYDSHPPSLCLRNSTICGQGNVPLYAVSATSAADIQAGVNFARTHNLRVSIKASGHDYLGRSTARDSLLLWTHSLQNINFTDHFIVNGKDKGSAVTVGSGVTLNMLYPATKAQGKIFVGGTAATIVPAGGYTQGGGHSTLSPTFGLASDNVLQFQVVLANGNLVTVNEAENSDLFWAMRGGGSGSWGVVISVTLQTFPTFDAAFHSATIHVNTTEQMGNLATLHAHHVYDWAALHAGQYFYVYPNGTNKGYSMVTSTYIPNGTVEQANEALKPFLDGALAQGASVQQSSRQVLINDVLTIADDGGGANWVLGSRLIPDTVYKHSPQSVGKTYTALLNEGISHPNQSFLVGIFGHLVAGGKVAENANISSAVNPAWRTARAHIVIANGWPDSDSPADVITVRQRFTSQAVSLLEDLAGPGSGSYINEADVREPHFETTFFGLNYPRLTQIKRKYDANDLFIVGAGVGSERWDEWGLCRV